MLNSTVKDFIESNSNLAYIYSLASDPIVGPEEIEAYIKGAITGFNDEELSIMLRLMSYIDKYPNNSIQYCIGFAVYTHLNK